MKKIIYLLFMLMGVFITSAFAETKDSTNQDTKSGNQNSSIKNDNETYYDANYRGLYYKGKPTPFWFSLQGPRDLYRKDKNGNYSHFSREHYSHASARYR